MTARTVDTALDLVGCAIALKLHVQLAQPDDARRQVDRAIDLLSDLDAALTPKALGRHPAHESR